MSPSEPFAVSVSRLAAIAEQAQQHQEQVYEVEIQFNAPKIAFLPAVALSSVSA